MTMYRLENKLDRFRSQVMVVGCGGTGGFVAEGLCRLLIGRSDISLVLIDHDRVEERNLLRQSFYPEDLGRFKAEALAERLARKYRRPVAYALEALGTRDWGYGIRSESRLVGMAQAALVIGCVDNALARQSIAAQVGSGQWWIDAGNGRDFGQVLVGNARVHQLARAFNPEKGLCRSLPLPTLVQPDLLSPTPPAPPCAEAVAAAEQSPTINQAVAVLVLEVVRRLLEGTCTWWQVYLDLGAGTLRTVEASPEVVAKSTGTRVAELLVK